jgi:acetylornithine deacetylase/succinyl-diaminopimelate desuccinylase family protein
MADADDVIRLIGIEEVTSLAAGLVVAPGHNPPGDEAATVEVLAQACRLRGLEPIIDEVRPGRPNLRAVLGGGDAPGLLLLGHSDVVPPGDAWTVHPYGGLVRDGRLYGRGAADMKGGLAAVLVALGAIKRAGIDLSGPVELAVTVDEEDRALGVQHYLTTGDRSGFAGCVVAEPTDLQPIIAARGDSYLTISVSGRAAHAGNPADGANAIYGATRVIDDLRDWHAELAANVHPLVGPATVSVGRIDGGTGPSIVAAECEVIADRRLLPTESGPDVLDQLRSRVDRLALESDGLTTTVGLTLDMPGFESEPDSALVRAVCSAALDAGGPELPVGGWSAACDGGFLAREAKLPVVVYGPGSVSGQAHRADESVPLDQLVIAARSYALIILRLLGVS